MAGSPLAQLQEAEAFVGQLLVQRPVALGQRQPPGFPAHHQRPDADSRAVRRGRQHRETGDQHLRQVVTDHLGQRETALIGTAADNQGGSGAADFQRAEREDLGGDLTDVVAARGPMHQRG